MTKELFNFNTEYKTLQSLFNAVWHGMAKQGFKQSVGAYSCLYAGPNGLACAVGCLVPRKVGEELDTHSFGGVVALFHKGLLRAGPRRLDLLEACQTAHDAADSRLPEEMQRRLRDVAGRFGLSVPGEGVE